MRKTLICLLVIMGFAAQAQVFNNEWIDYSKTYYKFKVARTGLYCIRPSYLNADGLSTAQ